MKKSNIVKDKSFAFALRVIKLYKFLTKNREFVMSKQLLRSGTAVGAIIRESEHAESKADFIHKLAIAQKEANESEYWIELLFQSEYLDSMQYESISNDITEIRKILAAILISSKRKN
jgi:four helix bundle protein